jgi:Cro/C1-type HTH DNA-binding domain
MNFTQLQERLRLELLRRIDRGSVNGALLARQTGFQPSHISNFLRRRRTLSLSGLDRLLAAQMLTIGDLLALEDVPTAPREAASSITHTAIPVVAPSAAIHDPVPPSSATLDLVQLPLGLLEQMRSRRATSRRGWSRFVSVRVTRQQAIGMQPVLPPETIAVIDRHYNSPVSYQPPQPSIFAVRVGNALQFRLAEFENNRLILRPIELTYPVQLLALGPHEMPSDLIVGRICLSIAPIP